MLEKGTVLVVITTFNATLVSRLSLNDSQKDHQDHCFQYNCYVGTFL